MKLGYNDNYVGCMFGSGRSHGGVTDDDASGVDGWVGVERGEWDGGEAGFSMHGGRGFSWHRSTDRFCPSKTEIRQLAGAAAKATMAVMIIDLHAKSDARN